MQGIGRCENHVLADHPGTFQAGMVHPNAGKAEVDRGILQVAQKSSRRAGLQVDYFCVLLISILYC